MQIINVLFKDWLIDEESFVFNEAVEEISFAEVQRRKMFGPVYHGTSQEKQEVIKKSGFHVFIGGASTGNVTHGYGLSRYGGTPYPPPVHHLGYGIYFTTSKSIGKMYNGGTVKGLREYYLDVPRLLTINFASESKMMNWWRDHGYDMDESMDEGKRIQATINLTNNLKEKYDAVYFKGKGIHKLLDGDQICVFDPNRVYVMNPDLSAEGELAPKDRFVIKDTDVVAKVVSISSNGDIYVSYDDPLRKVLARYGDEFMRDTLARMDDEFMSRIIRNTNSENSEEAVKKYLDFHFPEKQRLQRFPKEWIGRRLRKGERI